MQLTLAVVSISLWSPQRNLYTFQNTTASEVVVVELAETSSACSESFLVLSRHGLVGSVGCGFEVWMPIIVEIG